MGQLLNIISTVLFKGKFADLSGQDIQLTCRSLVDTLVDQECSAEGD